MNGWNQAAAQTWKFTHLDGTDGSQWTPAMRQQMASYTLYQTTQIWIENKIHYFISHYRTNMTEPSSRQKCKSCQLQLSGPAFLTPPDSDQAAKRRTSSLNLTSLRGV